MSKLAAAGTALAVIALAACNPASSTTATVMSTPTLAAATKPAAALPVLRKTGAMQQVSYGFDVEGDGNASGSYPSQKMVTVYTFADQAAMDAALARNNGFAPTSSYVWITGRLLAVEVTGVISLDSNSTGFPVSPKTIAQKIGGTVASG